MRVKWGDMAGVDAIQTVIGNAHAKIVAWKKNLFEVPPSKCGKDFIAEATRLLKHFNTKSNMEPVAINLLVIFFPLMLQKPSRRSKPEDHKRYLSKRLEWWKDGKISNLLSEAEEIQKRLLSTRKIEPENRLQGFARLMTEGKVKQTLKLVDADNTGLHSLSDHVRDVLRVKRPEASIQGEIAVVQPVIFEEITAEAINLRH